MCYPWRCPGRWPVCIQLYGHGAEAPIDGYCTRILAFRGLSACQGSLNSSKIVVNEMVLTCLKCPWIQCFQGIIRFWLDFYGKNTAVSGDTAGKTKNGCIPMPEVSHQKRRVTSAFFTRVIGLEAGGILWEKCHRLF